MKAVILVGGKATRLEPLTCNTPKAVVPVLNMPFLEHVIRHLARHQITDVILALGHLAPSITGYLGDGSRLGVKLYYSLEDRPLGTAGAVKHAERYLDKTFLMLNGDIFTDLNITAMIGFHREKGAKATIAVTPVDDPTAYGLIETDALGRITRFLEKPKLEEVRQRRTNLINAGTYVLEPDIQSLIPPGTKVSIERETFQQLLAQGEPMYAYSSPAYWIDTGTPEKYLQLHRDLLSGKCPQYALPVGDKVLVGAQTSVHPTARIKGPVIIGANCVIGRNVKLTGPVVIGDGNTILEDSVIEDSVIWRNARLGPGACLKRTIVADNCRLEATSTCEDSVLGDNVTLLCDCKLEPGSRIQPGTTVGAET